MAVQPLPVQHLAIAARHPELGLRDPAQDSRQDSFDHMVHRFLVGGMAVVAHEEHPLFAAGAAGNPAAPEETAVDSNGNGTQLGWRHEFRQELSVLAGHADHGVEARTGPDLVVELHHPVVPLRGSGPGVAGSLESLGRIGVLHLVEGEDLAPNGLPGDMLGHLKIFGLDDVEPPAPEHLADFGGHLGAGELIVLGRPGYPQVPDRNRQTPDRPGLHSQRLQPFQQLSLAFVLDKGNQRDPMFGGQDLQIVIHALGAAMEAETRGIGRKHQYVQGFHGRMGLRGLGWRPFGDAVRFRDGPINSPPTRLRRSA